MSANMKPAVFWVSVQCSLENVYKMSEEPAASNNKVDNFPPGSSAMLFFFVIRALANANDVLQP